ncbi:MAG: murein L,D-transpeptidase catalytic domain family protein [Bacteroidota bacterium]|nr:murein L,D-transpeptidase catalytic domain family protein [Bacteroidota bacterium]
MLRSIRFPIVFLFAFPAFTNFTFPVKNIGYSITYLTHDSIKIIVAEESKDVASDKYSLINLDKKGLSKTAFELAMKGYDHLAKKRLLRNKNILTVIDFSKPSSQKRLFVIDLKKNKLLFQSLVAHGRNSGLDYATSFSNEDDSHKSSLGFYVTLNTYCGECGYALKLKGCERGFNDKAYERAIVVHGSKYVTDEFLHSNGFLGRSWGCPALPEKISKKVIDVIKNGSCLFLYQPNEKYLKKSPVLNG